MSSLLQKSTTKERKDFILASGSPRRKELLAQLITEFEVKVPQVDEINDHAEGVLALVQENARIKAMAVSQNHYDSWVLGADTVVVLGDQVLGKPDCLERAVKMLRGLSHKTHRVCTGVCLIHRASGYNQCRVESSLVTFRRLNDQAIDKYYQQVDPLDKAGGYAIQSNANIIVERFEGSFSNIVGLPTELLRDWFSELEL